MKVGVEICEDGWVPISPSSYQALAGATIIANLSASNDTVGKAAYRKEHIADGNSARLVAGYVYASCGVHESTTDVIFSGHLIISKNGITLAESERFNRDGEVIVTELDIDHLIHDRIKTGSFGESIDELGERQFRYIDVDIDLPQIAKLKRTIDPSPFTSTDPGKQEGIVREVFSLQVHALATRMEHANISKVFLGLSGGLDSTNAMLVVLSALAELGLPTENLYTISMPSFGTSSRTRNNAKVLAEAAATRFEEIDITDMAELSLKKIGHDGVTQDTPFENVQARIRTEILLNKAGMEGGLVINTGDLSEIALGWCTFNADHIGHYAVNCGVPKTLVRYIINWIARNQVGDFRRALIDILKTPVSPELVKESGDTITQLSEDKIGPYILNDFFLYHFVRWGSSPSKILYLARHAFEETEHNDIAVHHKWLTKYLERFFNAQKKRSLSTDGPKVGSVSLSCRGDWRMPSDADVEIWLNELK